MQCKYLINGHTQCKLKAISGNINGYCFKHKNNFKYPKPKNCPVCLCSIHQTPQPLECGHWVHKSCIIKSGHSKCPICRYELNIEIKNSYDNSYDEDFIEAVEIPYDIIIFANLLYQIYQVYIQQRHQSGQNYIRLEHFISIFLNDILPINNPLHNYIVNSITRNINQFL
jgi:hypothetical protein